MTATGGSITLDVNQIPPGTYNHPMAVFQNQVLVYDENCNTYSNFSFSTTDGDVHLTINGTTAGHDYIVSVKYTPGNLVGLAPPPTNTVTYGWRTEVGAIVSGEDSLDFVKKPGSGSASTLSTTTATPTTSVDSASTPSAVESTTKTSHGRSADHPTPQGNGKGKQK